MKHKIHMLIWLILAIVPTLSFADLTPNEVAILANGASRESVALAGYYAKQRNIPIQNICRVTMPTDEVLKGAEWTKTVRPAVQSWLLKNDRSKTIRCIVTVWDVPLKIDRIPDPTRDERVKFLKVQRANRIRSIRSLIDEVASMAPEEYEKLRQIELEKAKAAANNDATKPEEPQKSDIALLRDEIQKSITRLQTAVLLLDDDERSKIREDIELIVRKSAGENALFASLTQMLQTAGKASSAMASQFQLLKGRNSLFVEARLLAEAQPYTPNRDILLLDLVTRHMGLMGSVEWIDQHLEFLKISQTASSFDSELSLVLWKDYATTRWQSNYLNAGFAESSLSDNYPVIMVSRIDAPTLKRAKTLIDTAIRVEKTGLKGDVYLDARGLSVDPKKQNVNGSYEQYDKSLILAEKVLEETTALAVTLDRTPALFQPDSCKNAALYCGWYSVAKYVDAFDWNPGAIAYHLASSEAATLKKPESEVWCKKLLEDGDGVCATIGPVYEPYLIAFPRPDRFFPELLSGNTLVESYYATKSFNSWMMVLIGDPLYRPYKQ